LLGLSASSPIEGSHMSNHASLPPSDRKLNDRYALAGRLARMRDIVVETVTLDDIRVIISKLVEKARDGDREAAKLLFHYVLGKPSAFHAAADLGDLMEAREAAD